MTVLQISPLSPALGAEVSGIDWHRDPGDDEIKELCSAFLTHQLLCLKAPVLPPEGFTAVARWFGVPQLQLIRASRKQRAPEVSQLETTYQSAADKPTDISHVRLSGWHTDDSYFQCPAKATLLQALEIPSRGGETRFANTQSAYDDLDQDLRRKLEPLTAIHRYDTARAKAPPKSLLAEEAAETREARHPLIRRHEDTGRRAIYFNSNRTDHIEDLSAAESNALLDRLHAHTSQKKYQYHHSWHRGDILLWDNRNLIHSVNMDFPVGEKRIHQRILLTGTVPYH